MQVDQYWHEWAHLLQRWGLQGITASFLEAAAPAGVILAQCVYMGQPFMREHTSSGQMDALAAMLENRQQTLSFARYLREESKP
jgi:hypothetical protein